LTVKSTLLAAYTCQPAVSSNEGANSREQGGMAKESERARGAPGQKRVIYRYFTSIVAEPSRDTSLLRFKSCAGAIWVITAKSVVRS